MKHYNSLLGAVFTAEVLLVSVSVDPPDVLLHVAGGDQSSTVLAHFLIANLNLLSVIFRSVLHIQRFTVETFITVKASIFPLFPRSPWTWFCIRGVLFIHLQLHIILQEIVNTEDGLLFPRVGYLCEPGVTVVAHFLLRGQSGAEPGEEDDPLARSRPLDENISDVRLQETVLHSQHQALLKPGTGRGAVGLVENL